MLFLSRHFRALNDRYQGEDRVAGKVGDTLFYIADLISFVCACVAILALMCSILVFRAPWRNAFMGVRIAKNTMGNIPERQANAQHARTPNT